jgi:hypothetical protein
LRSTENFKTPKPRSPGIPPGFFVERFKRLIAALFRCLGISAEVLIRPSSKDVA